MTELEINNLVSFLNKERSHVFYISPNYEDRSIGLLEHLISLKGVLNFSVVLLKLQSKNYKVEILEDLKLSQYQKVVKALSQSAIDFMEVEVAYPDRYTSMTIEHLFRDTIEDKNCEVVFDFSCLPKVVIIDICKFICGQQVCSKFSFAYSSAKEYPKIRHPQAIGDLRGIISHKSLSKLLETYHEGTLVNFPGDLGYSGQLISDQVSKHPDFDQYVFIYMRRRNPLSAYDAMAGNMHLLGEAYREWRNNVINHFTIQDGFRKLTEIVEKLENKLTNSKEKHLVIFAPFGPKPLVVGCFLMMKKLEKFDNIAVDIIQESSFQYSSVYSIGIDKTYLFYVDMPSQK